MTKTTLTLLLAVGGCAAAPAADLVDQLPGFDKAPFKVYSGYLTVPGPFELSPYDELKIHYQFHESQGKPSDDPVVTWHQGGPGGSSIYGLYGEMGYFQIDSAGPHANAYAWNNFANMLYLESPAGSNWEQSGTGYSTCSVGGEAQKVCSWDDVSQAEAYAHTLAAFFAAFPEYAPNDLYLTGESYAGQYVPNIANWIVEHEGAFDTPLNLKGFAVGNACWGGTETEVLCNGANAEQNDVDMYYGKGLISKKLYGAVYDACYDSRHGRFTLIDGDCEEQLEAASHAVGAHNVYDIYDNCDDLDAKLAKAGRSPRWLRNAMRARMQARDDGARRALDAELRLVFGATADGEGGFPWGCDQMDLGAAWITRDDVRAALHLGEPGSGFSYSSSGPASVTLYPSLVKKLRILIYNGDADDCVPYKGNEEWTTRLADDGVLAEKDAWHPWTVAGDSIPAGYATTYTVNNATADVGEFAFITIRLAGHMVPAFQPRAAASFFGTWIAGGTF